MTHWCNRCDREFTNARCPRCGNYPARGRDHDDPAQDRPIVSEVPDSLVAQASRPTLASLVKAGVKKGLIQIMPEYGSKKRA